MEDNERITQPDFHGGVVDDKDAVFDVSVTRKNISWSTVQEHRVLTQYPMEMNSSCRT